MVASRQVALRAFGLVSYQAGSHVTFQIHNYDATLILSFINMDSWQTGSLLIVTAATFLPIAIAA